MKRSVLVFQGIPPGRTLEVPMPGIVIGDTFAIRDFAGTNIGDKEILVICTMTRNTMTIKVKRWGTRKTDKGMPR